MPLQRQLSAIASGYRTPGARPFAGIPQADGRASAIARVLAAPGLRSRLSKLYMPDSRRRKDSPVLTIDAPVDADLRTLRSEFLAMPGLCLTVPQVARLLSVPQPKARDLLDRLIGEGLLVHTVSGVYRRVPRLASFIQPATQEGQMLRSFALALAASLGLAAAASAQDARIAKGIDVYAAQKCALCHSIGDKGNKKGPLDEVASKYTLEELRAWIVDAKGMTAKTKAPRKPLMNNYTLPKDELDALVAYMASLKKK
jgi:mono/diheme cytochrome c family protein